jgi:hypothetical protein
VSVLLSGQQAFRVDRFHAIIHVDSLFDKFNPKIIWGQGAI